MIRLYCLNPNGSAATTAVICQAAERWSRGHGAVEVATEYLPEAPELLITEEDNRQVEPWIWDRAAALGGRGFDGMLVACHGDPGLPRGYAAGPPPVVGMGWASMRRAAACGSFAVVAVDESMVGEKREQATRYGLEPLVVVGAARRDYESGSAQAAADLDQEVAALRAQGAAAVVLGCANMSACAPALGAGAVDPVEAGLDALLELVQREGLA